MNKEILAFCDIEIKNCKFHCSKYPTDINNVDIDKIMISNEVSFGCMFLSCHVRVSEWIHTL